MRKIILSFTMMLLILVISSCNIQIENKWDKALKDDVLDNYTFTLISPESDSISVIYKKDGNIAYYKQFPLYDNGCCRIEEIEMYWYLDDEGKNWEIEYDNTDGVWYKKEVNYTSLDNYGRKAATSMVTDFSLFKFNSENNCYKAQIGHFELNVYFDGPRLSKITSTVENYTDSLEFSDYGNVKLILPETIVNMN